ncbi:hypothetical protein Tco_0577524 [Tanacetum coccineum]
MKVEESLNVTFDESPPPTKLSPLVDDDVGECPLVKYSDFDRSRHMDFSRLVTEFPNGLDYATDALQSRASVLLSTPKRS